MPTPAIQTLINDAQQVLNLDSISAVRSVVAVSLANANTGTPLNPNLTTQQLWNEFYQVVTRSKSDIESIIANQLMKFLYSPPAPGGVGANKQVIFNDGGVLAGDAGLTYDKATDSLTVLGNLGVGVSPSHKFEARGNVVSTSAGGIATALSFDTNGLVGTISNHSLGLMTNGVPVMRLDTSGNVGIGVTPSAWPAASKAIDVDSYGANYAIAAATQVGISRNCYYNGTNWIYKLTTSAQRFEQDNGGGFKWFTAAAGTAGTAITFTQAMTLDASGRLLVGPTSANTSGGVLQLSSGITFPATQVASSDANTLDDYEEGTFTPIVRGSTTSGTGTYTTQFGRYTKVGRLVTVTVTLNWTAHTGTGNLQFAGLPFVSANTASAYDGIAIAYQSNISSAANTVLYGLVEFGSTVVTMTATPVGGGGYGLVAMDTAGEIAFTVTYTV